MEVLPPYDPATRSYFNEGRALDYTYSIAETRALANEEFAKRNKGVQGSYTITFSNNKKYHGKGPFDRMIKSALLRSVNGVLPKFFNWTPCANEREAFKAEYRRMQEDANTIYPEGYQNPINYNIIQSPGKAYILQDGR